MGGETDYGGTDSTFGPDPCEGITDASLCMGPDCLWQDEAFGNEGCFPAYGGEGFIRRSYLKEVTRRKSTRLSTTATPGAANDDDGSVVDKKKAAVAKKRKAGAGKGAAKKKKKKK